MPNTTVKLNNPLMGTEIGKKVVADTIVTPANS